jgi:hypothetical protein
MRIGYPWWHTVTTDTVGVPRSACFGDIDRLEPVLNEMGLQLGWNQPAQCYAILQQLGPSKWTCHLQLRKKDGSPVLLCDKLITVLRMAKEEFGAETTETIRDWLKKTSARQEYEEAARRQAEKQDLDKDFLKELGPRPLITYARN